MNAATSYRVLSAPGQPGGKLVTVFPDAGGDLRARAAAAGSPLSVFVERADEGGLHLRVFTPTREKGESDSGALAALAWLQARGRADQGNTGLADLGSVWMGGQEYPAQLCSGEWLLSQGDGRAEVMDAPLEQAAAALGLSAQALSGQPALRAEAGPGGQGRPNLLLSVPDAAALDRAVPDAEALKRLGQDTGTTGLILYTLAAGRGLRADFRVFGPLKGFLEDAASSNSYACLLAGLSVLGALDPDELLVRASQGRAGGHPSRLTAQALPVAGGVSGVWVGGAAVQEAAGQEGTP